MATIQSPAEQRAEQRVVLNNISWRTYADLLDAPRFTYDMGESEARSPLPKRERYNRAIQVLAPTLAS